MKSLILQILLFFTLFYPQNGVATPDGGPPFTLPERADILKLRSAVLETTKGDILLELFPEDAPWHVANLKYLADKGFYRGLTFHLFEAGYLIQGGDPRGNGQGGPGYTLPPEFSSRAHKLGTLGMARRFDAKGEQKNPERRSSGSQFRIFLGDAPHMDGQFTIFGKVIAGFEAVNKLRAGDKILNLTVFVRTSGGR